ncbi:hypothetical protein 7F11_31 [uncultured Caudovirales phage]|uniref:Uncharacterized protein n=3 Tax=root TaxID=1 RepID=A0A2H4IZT6_9CAUD|nr:MULTISPECIES: hypothetical protein [Pseudomonas]ASN67341.1 hypothetical protein 7AX2_43 [uncultured phage]ASN67381.1 hypothetical protein 2AX2_10 [uncultured Caudovirales phage]ASN67583.1 hypothetical protein 9AX5_8 [uncultured Caudovirales phage]ASN68142.1 hypothetical protein 7S5_22 [uncultured Caudovirales phage]ASN68848.1 hypothetical protein 10F10_25 [uncultured Caudovirales phage]
MNTPTALARLGLEIAKMKKSCTPVPDRTFVMGMIEMAEFAEIINTPTANRYRDALDAKFVERNAELKRTAA